MSPFDLICTVLCGIIILISIVLIIIFLRSKHKDIVFNQHRNANLVLFSLLMVFSYQLTLYMIFLGKTYILFNHESIILKVLQWILVYLSIWSIWVRYIKTYYIMKRLKKLENMKWQNIINNETTNEITDTIQKELSLTNESKIIIVAAIFTVISCILSVTFQFVSSQDLVIGIPISVYSIMVFFCIIMIWCKTCTMFLKDDELYVYTEMKFVSILPFIITPIFVFNECLFKYYLKLNDVAYNIDLLMYQIGCIIYCYISTRKTISRLWILRQKQTITFKELLADINGYECFMKQLIKEMSMECLLSLTEFVQYRDYIKNKQINMIPGNNEIIHDRSYSIDLIDTDENTSYINVIDGVTLPDNIPNSSIVFGTNNIENTRNIDNNNDEYVAIKMMAIKLYNKYIITDSEYSINISYRTSNKLAAILGDHNSFISNNDYNNYAKLSGLFDKSIYEIYKIMKPTFRAFIKKTKHLEIG